MKKIKLFSILLTINLSCSYSTDIIFKGNKSSDITMKEYAAGEDILLHDKIDGKIIFTIQEGEIFKVEEVRDNKNWRKINLDDKIGYIQASKKIFDSPILIKNIVNKNYITYNKNGTTLCKLPSKSFKCKHVLKTLKFREKIQLIKPFLINGSGIWLKVQIEELIGFINIHNVIDESIYESESVDLFKKNFKKICSKKMRFRDSIGNYCYSTKIFSSGDAEERWKERVLFLIDEPSIRFTYGRMYVGADGLLFKVETIDQKTFQLYYLDSEDHSQQMLQIELDYPKKRIFAPLPETLMKGTYKQVSSEKLEFKNKLN